MSTGLVFSIQKYSTHDGPGIRTTVFLKGCPLHCWWCHNPEGQSCKPEIVVNETRCLGCGECRKVCPNGQGTSAKGEASVAAGCCSLCGACVAACTTGARQKIGREFSASEALAAILKDRLFYEDSGGGVTVSGGEPLAQPGFVTELLAACRAQGLHTAVDTCGLGQQEQLLALAAVTDLFLYDLKAMNEERHRLYTGSSNQLILENLRALGSVHSNIFLRMPIIPGINDDDADLEAAARLANSIPGVRQINLLPYHRTGIGKFRRLGEIYRLPEVVPPTPERLEHIKLIFENHGLRVQVGG